MKLHYLKHEEFEDLGCIRTWAEGENINITCTKLYKYEHLPLNFDFDILIILGGSMNVYEETLHPWLIQEKLFIKQSVDKGIPILGICLGAQLLSSILGGIVAKNNHKEIGWFPVSKSGVAVNSKFDSIFPENLNVFHWHGDAFTIPQNAVKLFSSKGCSNQGFIYKENVIALQFHLETEENSVALLCENCVEEIVAGEYIQDVNTMKELTTINISNANNTMFALLNYLILQQQ